MFVTCYFSAFCEEKLKKLKIGAKCTATTPYVIIMIDEVNTVVRGCLFCFGKTTNHKVQNATTYMVMYMCKAIALQSRPQLGTKDEEQNKVLTKRYNFVGTHMVLCKWK